MLYFFTLPMHWIWDLSLGQSDKTDELEGIERDVWWDGEEGHGGLIFLCLLFTSFASCV